jgi:hypothetical protein
MVPAVENKLRTTEMDSLAGEPLKWNTWVLILPGHFKLRLHNSVYKNWGAKTGKLQPVINSLWSMTMPLMILSFIIQELAH